MKTDTQIGIRISQELKDRIEQQAIKEQRSISNLIIKVITNYLNEVKKTEERSS